MKFLRIFVLFSLVFVASLALAQTTTLKFPDKGERKVWIAATPGDSVPENATVITTDSQPLDLKQNPDTDRIFVLNTKTGNMAAETVGAIKEDPTWTVGPEAETLLGVVRLRIEHEGKPLAAGLVKANSGGALVERVLGPSNSGVVELIGLKPGKLSVTVTYTTEGKTKVSTEQIWDLKLKRDDPNPTMVVSIPDKVDVVEGVAAGKSEGKAPEKKAEEGSAWNFGRVFIFLLAIAVAVAAFFVLRNFLTGNESLVKDNLAKVGITIPDDQAQIAQAADPTPLPKAPEPMKPIILDDAPVMDPISVPVAVVNAVANPRLVSSAGDLVLIPDGGSVVGREATADVPMPDQPSLSRRHAELQRVGDTVTVRDLGSTNKTYVNGQPIGDSPVTLNPGDAVQFGMVGFRYEV